ncbi:MAG: bifunctional 4-hydroxy-2-oxoglutarate aldolase/2-dehydro-3-deoxy-phosphogluconate aldolase [Candidatus Caldatribacteriaceae bacterium]
MTFTNRWEVVKRLMEGKIIAIIRAQNASSLLEVVKALKEGGIKCIEVTMTTPGALKLLEEVREKEEGILFGAGTILDPETARLCILSGAQFLVTPSLHSGVIEMAHRYDIPIIPGAFTPTEILNAWERGAEIVKVFPASSVGPQYIKELKGPFPHIKLCPTGGVNLENIAAFFKAGATCVGVGSSLVSPKLIKESNWDELRRLAQQFQEELRRV